jgi:hypothetical protein
MDSSSTTTIVIIRPQLNLTNVTRLFVVFLSLHALPHLPVGTDLHCKTCLFLVYSGSIPLLSFAFYGHMLTFDSVRVPDLILYFPHLLIATRTL